VNAAHVRRIFHPLSTADVVHVVNTARRLGVSVVVGNLSTQPAPSVFWDRPATVRHRLVPVVLRARVVGSSLYLSLRLSVETRKQDDLGNKIRQRTHPQVWMRDVRKAEPVSCRAVFSNGAQPCDRRPPNNGDGVPERDAQARDSGKGCGCLPVHVDRQSKRVCGAHRGKLETAGPAAQCFLWAGFI